MADDFIAHLESTVMPIADPFLQSRYNGFVAVSAVTVYELAISDILVSFASRKHRVLGAFVSSYFSRLNGRIRLKHIREDYIKRFGGKYLDSFDQNLEEIEQCFLHSKKVSPKNAYSNLITWRNEFAHEGRIPSNATYEEIRDSYQFGKNIIHCLSQTMQ
jgi:hypothetical protein